jgi:hypothetical protein
MVGIAFSERRVSEDRVRLAIDKDIYSDFVNETRKIVYSTSMNED